MPSSNARIALTLLASPLLVVAVLSVDAQRKRHAKDGAQAAVYALSQRLPTGDLALSGGARWLRSVSLEEPGAAFADGPTSPDPDPAGALMAPPEAVWRAAVSKGNTR